MQADGPRARRQAQPSDGSRISPAIWLAASSCSVGGRDYAPERDVHRRATDSPVPALGRLQATLDLESVRLHDMRHYTATELGQSGTSVVLVATVADRLGVSTHDVWSVFARWMGLTVPLALALRTLRPARTRPPRLDWRAKHTAVWGHAGVERFLGRSALVYHGILLVRTGADLVAVKGAEIG